MVSSLMQHEWVSPYFLGSSDPKEADIGLLDFAGMERVLLNQGLDLLVRLFESLLRGWKSFLFINKLL